MSRRARVHRDWLERAGPGVAWSLLGATVVALAGAALLGAANSAVGMGDWLAPLEFLWALAWLGFGMVGALLAQQRPRNPIGWILLGIPFAVYVSLLLTEYAVRGLVVAPGSRPVAGMAWVMALRDHLRR